MNESTEIIPSSTQMISMERTPTSIAAQNIEAMILRLGAAEADEISSVTNMVKFFASEGRRLESLRKQVLVERIVATGQDIILSPTLRLYVGSPPEYELRGDGFELFKAMFEVCGGDLFSVYQMLSAKWYSVSKVRSGFEECGQPEMFEKFILTTREPELKEGKPVKQLIEKDTTFTSRPKAGITAKQRGGFLK